MEGEQKMKDIKGYEGRYGITSCGKVWSYYKNDFLKPSKRGADYWFVSLYNGYCYTSHYIHRLVAEAYIPNPENLPDIDHIDGNKDHNYINNLQWMTHQNNVSKAKGDLVKCIETGETFNSQRAAAKFCNGNHHGISRSIETGKPYHGFHFIKI